MVYRINGRTTRIAVSCTGPMAGNRRSCFRSGMICSPSTRKRAARPGLRQRRQSRYARRVRGPLDQLTLSVPSPGAIYKDLVILRSSVPDAARDTGRHLAPTTFVPAHCSGPFTPFPVRATSVMTPGPRTHGTHWRRQQLARPRRGLKRGLVFVSTRSAHSISTAPTATGTISSQTRSSAWTPIQASASGTSKRSSTIYGTLTSRALLAGHSASKRQTGGRRCASRQRQIRLRANRETGESLFPMEERPFPLRQSRESNSPDAACPDKPAPFSRQEFTEDMVTKRTDAVHQRCSQSFALWTLEVASHRRA